MWQTDLKLSCLPSTIKAPHRCFSERPRVREWDTRRDLARDTLEWQHLSTPSTSRLVTRKKWPTMVKCRQVSVVCSHTWHFLSESHSKPALRRFESSTFSPKLFFFFYSYLYYYFHQNYYILSLVEMIRNNGF